MTTFNFNMISIILSIFALAISSASFYLSYKNYKSKIVKLNISCNECTSLGFIWYQKYRILYVNLDINNASNTDTDISNIYIEYNGNRYFADFFEINDTYNPDGITLISSTNPKEGRKINLMSNNILNFRKINANGFVNGFAVFNDFPILTKEEKLNLTIVIPSKKYIISLLGKPLSNEYHPINPINE